MMFRTIMNKFGKGMLALVCVLVLGVPQISSSQGIPFLPMRGGTITGTVKAPGNLPAASVRVSVIDISDKLTDIGAQQSIVSLGETDAEGHFRLEDIPPGRYFIFAGRVDGPTYYPGTTEIGIAKPILVTAGTTISGVDFAIEGLSIRVLDQRSSNISIPIEVVSEGGSRIPIFANGNFVVIRWSRKDGVGVQAKLSDVSANVPLYPTGVSEYQVTVENLPGIFREVDNPWLHRSQNQQRATECSSAWCSSCAECRFDSPCGTGIQLGGERVPGSHHHRQNAQQGSSFHLHFRYTGHFLF